MTLASGVSNRSSGRGRCTVRGVLTGSLIDHPMAVLHKVRRHHPLVFCTVRLTARIIARTRRRWTSRAWRLRLATVTSSTARSLIWTGRQVTTECKCRAEDSSASSRVGLVLESLEPRCVSPAALTRTRPLRQLSGNRKARTLIRVLAVPGRALPAVTPQRAVFQSRPYELMRQTGITGPRAGDECSAAAPPDAQNIRAAQLSLGPIAVR